MRKLIPYILILLFIPMSVFGQNVPPSLQGGFAHGPSESDNPKQWKGLVGCWAPVLGVTGRTLPDLSGYGNHGVFVDSPTWEIGNNPKMPGYVLDVPGAANVKRVRIPNNGTGWVKNRAEITIVIWLKVQTIASYDAILGQGAWGSGYLEMYQTSNLWAYLIPSTGSSYNGITPAVSYLTTADDTFHQVVMTVRFGDVGYVYSDGINIETDAGVSGTSTLEAGGDLYLGGFSDIAGMDCQIGYVAFYDRFFNQAQVTENFNDPLGMFRLKRRVYKAPGAAPSTRRMMQLSYLVNDLIDSYKYN